MNAPSTHSAASVFVSYSRCDLPFVQELVDGLRAAAFETWIDLECLVPSQNWKSQIREGLEGCTHFILVISPYALKSKNVREEIQFAFDNKKRIVTVLLQDTEMEERLRAIQWIDFRTRFEQPLEELVDCLRQPVEPPTTTTRIQRHVNGRKYFAPAPRAVRVITTVMFIGGLMRTVIGMWLLANLGFRLFYRLLAVTNQSAAFTLILDDAFFDDATSLLGLGILFALFGLLQCMSAIFCSARKVNSTEMLFVNAAQVGLSLFVLTENIAPPPMVTVGSMSVDFSWFLDTRRGVIGILPLDILALFAIFTAKSYRRWMPASSSATDWFMRLE